MSLAEHQEALAHYDELIASHPKITRKGKANPYTSHNGHMFTFFGKDGKVALRMAKADREDFLEQHNTQLAVSYNTVMKEYVSVPDALLEDRQQMEHYLQMSFDYVCSLKPKATTK
ncbi:MAG: TfoX/Sxy family protein [Salibacteraceae bacterium]